MEIETEKGDENDIWTKTSQRRKKATDKKENTKNKMNQQTDKNSKNNNWGKRNETTYHKGMKVKDMRPINNLGIHDNTRLKNNNNNK